MTTPLRTTLKRALIIDGREFVVTLDPTQLKLTLKGKRNGVELAWNELVNGDAALAVALQASVAGFDGPKTRPTGARKSKKRPVRRGKPA
jgi:hypothetical protein